MFCSLALEHCNITQEFNHLRYTLHLPSTPWLAVEKPWLALGGPFLTLLAQTGSGTTPLPL